MTNQGLSEALGQLAKPIMCASVSLCVDLWVDLWACASGNYAELFPFILN